MKTDRSTRILILLVILAAVFSAALSFLIVRQELGRSRSVIEYQVFQAMTGVVDMYNSDGGFDPGQWREVSGFGVYDSVGTALYRSGSAPPSLEDASGIPSRGYSLLKGSSMILVRRVGSMPSMRHVPLMGGPGPGFPPDVARPRDSVQGSESPAGPGRPSDAQSGAARDMGGMARMMNQLSPRTAAGRFILVEIDVEPLLRESFLVLLALCALLVVFFGIVFLLLAYSRRIAKYREREQDTAHLVQLGEAARTLAHEIKNPLGIIRVQCATLERTVPDERRKNIAVITEETERLALLADRVRDFLQTSGGVPSRCDADSFVSRCVERYAGRLSSVPRSGPPATVLVDPDRMVQILDNLVSNALEAGGEEPPTLSVSVRRGQAIYQIADRGTGVDSANRARLFKPFFTTKARGSGIGLALARRYALEAGGTIEYSPRNGGGSVFSVILPAYTGGTDHE